MLSNPAWRWKGGRIVPAIADRLNGKHTITAFDPDRARTRCLRVVPLVPLLTLLLAGLAATPARSATVGDVFVSYSADGVPSYASHRRDASYRLFIRGEKVPEVRSRVVPRANSDDHQQGKRQLAPLIDHYARLHDVQPALVAAVVKIESGFNMRAVSPKGAAGAMQLMPATAARYGVTDPVDAAQNIDAGVRHLKELLVQHQGNIALALAAYNAGEGAVERYQGVPPYAETRNYVQRILARLDGQRLHPFDPTVTRPSGALRAARDATASVR